MPQYKITRPGLDDTLITADLIRYISPNWLVEFCIKTGFRGTQVVAVFPIASIQQITLVPPTPPSQTD